MQCAMLYALMYTVPPVITQAPGRQIAVQGEEFFLRCAASGTPPPSFAFFKVCASDYIINRLVCQD